MTPFETALVERIKADGPLSVEAWMEACNTHYYATRDPLGESGDFTTAPEISQMYGELIGAALADCWVRAGKPPGVRYAELGGGRGTLASDALRVMRGVGFAPAAVELVETSPVLRAAQAAAVPEARFHAGISGLAEGDGPLLAVASEFFDALPIRQFVDGVERRVSWSGGAFTFAPEGPIVETSPARSAAMAELARVVVARGGAAIVIDYGHDLRRAVGDTLQAMAAHRKTDPLATPGEQDLTAHVDFAALGDAARGEGAKVSRLIAQGTWLETIGIAARAMALAARNPPRAEAIAAARRRLCDGEAMGTLFRVMAIAAPGWPLPAGLE